MKNDTSDIALEKLLIAEVRVQATQAFIPDGYMTLAVVRDPSLRGKIVSAMMHALTVPSTTVAYPADWWQAFKLRWFPRILQKRFVPKMTVRHFARYCPHAALLGPDSHREFLVFVEPKAPEPPSMSAVALPPAVDL